MAIPDFQSIMLPLLKFCSDGADHTNREGIDALAQEFALTEEEQKQYPLPPLRASDHLDNAKDALTLIQIKFQRGEIEDIDSFALTHKRLSETVCLLNDLTKELDRKNEMLGLENAIQLLQEAGNTEGADVIKARWEELRDEL